MPSRPALPDKPRRGDARRALLDAAHDLVRRQGWAATSVDQLCSVAGVTKGAFFHHFTSKEQLGIAAAQHWTDVTGPLFASAPYHQLADPLDRIFGYLDFRSAIADGPLEAITCFAGTMVQEVFASSDAIRDGCRATITDHAMTLAGYFREAISTYPPIRPADADSLALYSQTILQGGFVLSKALNDNTPLIDAIARFKEYLMLLFGKEPTQ